jgi:hypothetical protein
VSLHPSMVLLHVASTVPACACNFRGVMRLDPGNAPGFGGRVWCV